MKKQIALAVALVAASFAANAGDLSYSYVEAGWTRANVDLDSNNDLDFDGYTVRGSYGIDKFHVFGGYSSVNNDDLIDIDLNETQIGAGFHQRIDENADFIGEVSYLRQEVKASAFGVSAKDHVDGYRLSAGVRGNISQYVEGTIKLNYTDGSDLSSEFTPSAGVLVKFNPNWGLFVDAEASKDITRYAVGVRASF